MAGQGRSTRRWREVVRPIVLGRSTVCHWCGHPGATDVDHHPVPLRDLLLIDPRLAEDPDRCQPIHGRAGCSVCSKRWSRKLRSMQPRRCNQEKGAKAYAVPLSRGSRDW